MIKLIKSFLPTIAVIAIIAIVLAMPITLIAAPPLQTSSSPPVTSLSEPDPALLREASAGIIRMGYSTVSLPDNSLQVGMVVARQANGDLDVLRVETDRGGFHVGYFGKELFANCAPGAMCADITNPNDQWHGVATRTVDGNFVMFQIYDPAGKLSAQFVMFYLAISR